MGYNNNMAGVVKFRWDEDKRKKNIKQRGLDIAILAPKVFADPNAEIEPDLRKDYGEDRYLIYGMADDIRICICFTLRKEGEEDIIWLITIFKIHEKNWEKHYGKKNG
jgi:uncharacterized DUF497 family protein